MRPESQKLLLLIQAGNPIISMETPDEPRAVHIITEAAQALGRPIAMWSATEGLVSVSRGESETLVKPGRVAEALQYVNVSAAGVIYLFKDLGPHCKDPQVVRSIWDLYFSPDSRLWTLVMVDNVAPPPEVRRLTVPFDVGWPSEEELNEVVARPFKRYSGAVSGKSNRN